MIRRAIVALFFISIFSHPIHAQFASKDSILIFRPIEQSDSTHAIELGKMCWENRNTNLALSLISGRRAYEIAEFHHFYSILPQISNYLGIAYRNEGNYPKAIEYFLLALKSSSLSNNLREKSYAYNNVGEIYKFQNNFEDAYKNIIAASKIFLTINDTTGIAYTYLRLGETYLAEQKLDSAYKYLELSANYRNEQKDLRNYSVSLHRMAEVLFARGEYERAEKLFTQSLTSDPCASSRNPAW